MAAVQAITAKASFCQRLIVGVLRYRSSYDSPSIVSPARTRHQETAGEIIRPRLSAAAKHCPPDEGGGRRLSPLAVRPGGGHLTPKNSGRSARTTGTGVPALIRPFRRIA